MVEPVESNLPGHGGSLAVHTWPNPDARWRAVLVHGYGEHLGRYQHVADALVAAGAVVVGPDHVGHGRSAGERVLIRDVEAVVDDVHAAAATVAGDLPTVVIGHSMGGLIAARYAQRHRDELAALVLSGPVLGTWHVLDLLEHEQIPDTPIDPATLSRDPAVGAAYQADPLVWHGPFRRETLAALEAAVDAVNFGGPLEGLPVLWVHGEDDELVPLEETRTGTDRIRGLEFVERIYPGARHEVFNETNKDEVLGEVTAFVRQTLALD
ncbi:alpha/beta fold hydrolase [Goodfellowiella coeruleoviolacea]|uniref:Acylglycerol lipase n=1 Tax=Goodfellowiella coeruleoviolacea TaxID=334858 RepID=A0AAE3GKJ1_9PSEU|nr:alpha/beta fold hydrolase [Goodfellowiella coeruleoviolacea]MCP2169170.1 acylglycerol lipase [Goodfellowiella coeruleoviolacea]